MTNPTIRSFSRDIEVRFPEEGEVPEEIRDWWITTRENLERLKDKITTLTAENESLKARLSSLASSQNQFTEAQALQLARFVEFWEITSNGSLVPYANDTSDIGNAERKVRDIYELV